jgi:hypothetical protein
MLLLCCSCVAVATGVALLYAFFDVNYFIRIAVTIGVARLFQKKIKVLDGSRIYGKQRCFIAIGRGRLELSKCNSITQNTYSFTLSTYKNERFLQRV